MELARNMPWDRCLGGEAPRCIEEESASAVDIDVSFASAKDQGTNASFASAEDQGTEEPEGDVPTTCPICLDAIAQPVALACGHPFCRDCLRGYVRSRAMSATVELPCPCCKRESRLDELALFILGVPASAQADAQPPSQPAPLLGRSIQEGAPAYASLARPRTRGARYSEDWAVQLRAVRLRTHGRTRGEGAEGASEWAQSLRHAASSRLQLRYCPGCGSPVQKNGGCESMNCPCGARFRWTNARPVHPCRHCHTDGEGWWKTCVFCSRRAKAEKTALTVGKRTAIATAIAPLGVSACALAASAVGVGCAAAVTTAAAFGPPALIWEGVRRARGKPKWRGNKLLTAAKSGAEVATLGAFVVVMATCGWESD